MEWEEYTRMEEIAHGEGAPCTHTPIFTNNDDTPQIDCPVCDATYTLNNAVYSDLSDHRIDMEWVLECLARLTTGHDHRTLSSPDPVRDSLPDIHGQARYAVYVAGESFTDDMGDYMTLAYAKRIAKFHAGEYSYENGCTYGVSAWDAARASWEETDYQYGDESEDEDD